MKRTHFCRSFLPKGRIFDSLVFPGLDTSTTLKDNVHIKSDSIVYDVGAANQVREPMMPQRSGAHLVLSNHLLRAIM
jgi:hypothetical protein